MTPRSLLKSPATLMLALALLAGCGGGEAEPPPQPIGPTPPSAGPDTTPPTLTIANNVAAATANGPVTFTFVFSEDVGVSFDQSDVAVTGGTASNFVRVGGTQATLVVTPAANTNGTMSVSVAAGRFSDIAGNANTAAATGSKDYDVRLPTAPTTAVASPPARNAADVLSIFSDAYSPIAGIDLNPNWGQSTVATTEVIAGNAVRRYANLNYQGIDWAGSPINVSAMTRLHIDIWTANVTSVLVSIISAGAENAVTLTPTLAGWNSFDIDLAQYTAPNKNAIIQIKIEGTPGGGTLYFDNLYFWKPPSTTGPASPITFSSGFAGGGRTPEGGAYFSYSGSNQDGFNCTGGPAFCGSGDGGSGATSFFYAYYQTPTPATALYNGISVLAPGVTALSTTGDTPGTQLNGQTTVNFTFNNNPEWQASGTNNFGVLLKLGKFYDVDAGSAVAPCNITLLSVVTPLNNGAATAYAVPLSGFQVIQNCGTSISTVAAALASSPVSEIAFQAAGGGAALPTVGGRTTGANFTVAAGGVYPTTLALTGGITFGVSSTPTPQKVDFSTGFAGGGRTPEGGAYFSYSGSNQDGFNCTGGPAFCGNGDGGSGATSFFYAYYQTPTPATALYNGISVLAPGVTALSTTGDTPGTQLSGQTTVNFTFNNNPEWQASGTNNFGVILKLGKFYDVDAGSAVAPCNITLLSVVTPLNNGAATAYALPLSGFQVIQNCGTSISTVAAALASSPVSEIAFQAAGGGSALPTVGGKTTGANFTVAANGVYPTTLALTGGISFQP